MRLNDLKKYELDVRPTWQVDKCFFVLIRHDLQGVLMFPLSSLYTTLPPPLSVPLSLSLFSHTHTYTYVHIQKNTNVRRPLYSDRKCSDLTATACILSTFLYATYYTRALLSRRYSCHKSSPLEARKTDLAF
jgi:hypothetical protein